MEGRVLELSAGAKLGQGESDVRKEERSKASKRVRMGLERKAEERRQKSLEEVRSLAHYTRLAVLSVYVLSGKESWQLSPCDQTYL